MRTRLHLDRSHDSTNSVDNLLSSLLQVSLTESDWTSNIVRQPVPVVFPQYTSILPYVVDFENTKSVDKRSTQQKHKTSLSWNQLTRKSS